MAPRSGQAVLNRIPRPPTTNGPTFPRDINIGEVDRLNQENMNDVDLAVVDAVARVRRDREKAEVSGGECQFLNFSHFQGESPTLTTPLLRLSPPDLVYSLGRGSTSIDNTHQPRIKLVHRSQIEVD